MRRLYPEGTGSLLVEDESDPFQGVPRLWTMLNPTAQREREAHSATAAFCVVLTKYATEVAFVATTVNVEAIPQVVLSPASILDKVRTVFGLNVSEMAQVFHITRQTAYQWMSLSGMEQVRSHQNRVRLQQLYEAAMSWQSTRPLTGRWLYALLPSRNTVLDLLKAAPIDLNALRAAYAALVSSADARRREEGERATQAATALAGALTGLGAGRKARKGTS